MSDRFNSYKQGEKTRDRLVNKLIKHLDKCGITNKQIGDALGIVSDLVDCEIELEKFCN